MKQRLSQFLETLFLDSWWVVLFILVCYFCFEQGLRKNEREHALLQKQYDELVVTKRKVKNQNLELQRRINSQNDSATIELILMQSLGMVPEGKTKVLFVK